MSFLRRALLSLLLCLSATAGWAHEISMAEMELRQASTSEFLWQWTAGNRPGESGLRVVWPEDWAAVSV